MYLTALFAAPSLNDCCSDEGCEDCASEGDIGVVGRTSGAPLRPSTVLKVLLQSAAPRMSGCRPEEVRKVTLRC